LIFIRSKKMNSLFRCRLRIRLLNISTFARRCQAMESSSGGSSSKDKSNPSEKIIEERFRTKEPKITKGEVISRVNLAPQQYDTSMDDNFQRTTVEMLGEEMRELNKTFVYTYTEMGFTLADETMLIGPVALFPKSVLSWRVKTVDEITPESMLLFTLLEPKLDIVVVGVGDKKYIRPVKERLQPLFRQHFIRLEVLDTPDACATFNFLNKEGQYVAAALFPALEVIVERRMNLHSHTKNWDRFRGGFLVRTKSKAKIRSNMRRNWSTKSLNVTVVVKKIRKDFSIITMTRKISMIRKSKKMIKNEGRNRRF